MSDESAGKLRSAAPGPLASEHDVVEVFAERSFLEHLTIRFDRLGRRRERYVDDTRKGTGVRWIGGDKIRFRAVDSLDPSVVAATARHVVGEGAMPVRLDEAAGSLHLPLDAPDSTALDEKRSLLQAAADAAFSLEPDLDELRLEWKGTTRRIVVAATDVGPVRSTSSLVGISVYARRGRHEAHAVGGGPGGAGRFLHERPGTIAKRCIESLHAVIRSAGNALPSGRLPVVIEAGWGGVWLHEAVGHLLEADTGGPYRPDQIGRRVARDDVTIVDDGTLEEGRGSGAYDDEGTPSSRTLLVDRGVLTALLTDRVEAARRSLPRTGNGRRQDYRHQPMPRMTNLLLRSGARTRDAIISDIDAGVYVQAIGNGIFHPADDFYAFDVLFGYRIDRGRLTTPLTGLRMAGRASTALQDVIAVADDGRLDSGRGICEKGGQVVPVAVGTPTVLIDRMTVTPASV